MNQPTPAERANALIQEETRLLVQKAQLAEQIEAVDSRLASVRAALDGVRLGQALQAQAAEQVRLAQEAAEAEATDAAEA